jgi:hypothetical protein
MGSQLLFDRDRSAAKKETTMLSNASVQRYLSQNQPSLHLPLRAAAARRSVQNILQWNAYLPADCVRTMVRLGWDYTT